MGMNDTPSANRIHIGFFGRRNAGKSSIVNAVTDQDIALVSDQKGTTTDPVYKAMELLPMGPVMIIDTPGFDDSGKLGEMRVKKTKQVLNKTDVAVLVTDITEAQDGCEKELIEIFKQKNIPYIVVLNKCDLEDNLPTNNSHEICTSAIQKTGINELKEKISKSIDVRDSKLQIVGDLINPDDFVILVVPVDKAAPKGRLILPQQQTIRDILEADAAAIVVKEFELRGTLEKLGEKPAMVITDSQVFAKVSADTPPDIPLTSFSILMARYKGFLNTAVKGVAAVEFLKDGDRVLIAEGCSHHRQCDDIGSVKIPRWLRNYTGKSISIETVSGTEFPDELEQYSLIIHCGGCMLTGREMVYRMKCSMDQKIPFTNYGITIAYMQGILKRSIAIFPGLASVLEPADK
ncbi:MAG: [FeFe] hydrogenase H-cluster maturation GTPase HydF [Spirochaetales bacterium]|nr:[FeFe] hydrogenase H-cluster maturation GTPase HydF [Spirochaetales bacterium]